MQIKPYRLSKSRLSPRKIAKAKPAPVMEGARNEAGPASPSRAKHVLFVDDEALVARMGERILSKFGYIVTATTSSADALEKFRAEPQKFDVVVTDQTMPGLTGIGLAEKLVEIRPDIPIILTSGYGDEIDDQLARAAGISEYAPKPTPINSLSQMIEKLVTR
jgi:CheY-like chemotaxis protein